MSAASGSIPDDPLVIGNPAPRHRRIGDIMRKSKANLSSRQGDRRAIRRGDAPDTTWSDPGSTFEIPDRWQIRQLCGLHLTVGNNNRLPGGETFVIPESRTPWKVYGYAPNEQAPGQMDLTLIAEGEAASSEAARACAEASARAWRAPH